VTVKRYAATQGIVATVNLRTIYQREIFFQVDPMSLDYLDAAEVQAMNPSGNYIELSMEQFLDYLPEVEAEIFWFIFIKKKNQKDIAALLGFSQPTVSYRYRRTLAKLSYLMTLLLVDVHAIIDDMVFLKEREKQILEDLFFYVNQELVGQKYNVRQSSVKWIFVKTKRRIEEMERREPERWFNHFGLFALLETNLSMRVLH